MYILGIETSCDETGVAIYDTQFWESGQAPYLGLVGQSLFSQVSMHQEYGGVVPELASRDHIKHCLPLIEEVISKSSLTIQDIDAIAYTRGPGLAGALLVGTSIAKSIGFGLNIPCLGVHHLEGHLLSPLLSPDLQLESGETLFPFLALLVSGGHTQIMLVKGIGDYELLGETLDDAAGEAFDKTAKLLGLPYPGGPEVSALAKLGQPGRFNLPRPLLHSKDLNFSFAGLKTAVLTQTKLFEKNSLEQQKQLKADLAHEFVNAVVDVLTKKIMRAVASTGCQTIVVAGGVGANTQLRNEFSRLVQNSSGELRVLYPPIDLCTDNGAMIAFAGALKILNHPESVDQSPAFDVAPRWPLTLA